MLAEKLYHGTFRLRGNSIISSNIMKTTRGDKHWLGDGSYFFIEAFYAYKWILDMYKDRFEEDSTYATLTEHYMIIKASIKTNARILDLTKAEHKIVFDKVLAELNHKKEYSRRFNKGEFADGIVINYMFNFLDFKKDFDVVQGLFILNPKKYHGVTSRLSYMPQTQVCVKNLEVVTEIENLEYTEEHAEKYSDSIHSMYFDNICHLNGYKDNRPQSMSYTPRKASNRKKPKR